MRNREFSWLRMAVTLMGVMSVCGVVSVLGDTGGTCCSLEDGEDFREWVRGPFFRGVGESGGSSGNFVILPGSEETMVIRTVDVPLHVSGSGPIELSLVVQGSGHEESSAQLRVDGVPSGTLYRRRLFDANFATLTVALELTISRLELEALSSLSRGRWWEHTNFNDYDLLIILRRVTSNCSMLARVSGDLSGWHHGDIAYYNLFGPGEGVRNELASGNAADEEAHEILQDFVGSGGDMLEFLDDMGIELEEDARAAMEQAGQEAAEQLDDDSRGTEGNPNQARTDLEVWEDGIRHSGDNNFGLTLTAVQHAEGSESENYGGDSTSGIPSGLGEAMEALGAFSLGLSGKGSVAESIEVLGDVAVTSLWVAPGARDANLDAVKFFWEEGLPGSVSLRAQPKEGGLLEGILEARIRSDKKYDGRYLEITVHAAFGALEGLYSCSD